MMCWETQISTPVSQQKPWCSLHPTFLQRSLGPLAADGHWVLLQ